MSVRIMSQVWDHGPSEPMCRLVLLAIADHADEEGRAYPSMVGLAEKCGMTDRGVRGIIRKLEAGGYLITRVGGGRGGKSHYTVKPEGGSAYQPENPEQQTRNGKPGMSKPGTRVSKTRNETAQNPEPRSAEPSRTIKEPSEDKSACAPAPSDILGEVASSEAVTSFIAYRKRQRLPLTEVAARRIAVSLSEIRSRGGDPDDALGMAEERAWRTIRPDWYFRDRSPPPGTAPRPRIRAQLPEEYR